jgi:SAM-dependent methyltransferase
VFPTPAAALDGLAAVLALPAGARVLDAGCGTGAALRALARAFPQARLEGIEWSWPLAAWARRRCRQAVVRRGDFWREDWSRFDLVYMFQRPESMARAHAKLQAERPAGWLVSLGFEVPGVRPQAVLRTPDGRPLWVYRAASSALAAGR